MKVFRNVYRSLITSIREINAKYAKPSIEMTPFVKVNLAFLRFYLLFLVGLLIYKFIVTANQ